MSSLWTPGGEHPVDRDRADTVAPTLDDLADQSEEVDPEELAALRAEMDGVRKQLASVPAEVVVANHAMGLYELAAIHLSQQPPNLGESVIAIDAMGALVEGLSGRLGEAEPTLKDALAQLRFAFVQLKAQAGA